MNNRIGKFWVSFELVDKEPEQLSKVLTMMGFVPVEVTAHYQYKNGELLYCGISPMFKENPQGCVSPLYNIILFSEPLDDGGSEIVKVEVEEVPFDETDFSKKPLSYQMLREMLKKDS